MTTATKLTVTAWAASVGMSKQAGYKAVERCEIPVIDGLVDADVATLLYRRGTRPRAKVRPTSDQVPTASDAPPPPSGRVESYDEARRRREAAEASIAELKEAELRGELVRRAVVERELASRLVALREALEVLADRLSAQVAAESDPAACRRMLRDEHRIAMAALAETLAGAPDEDDDGVA